VAAPTTAFPTKASSFLQAVPYNRGAIAVAAGSAQYVPFHNTSRSRQVRTDAEADAYIADWPADTEANIDGAEFPVTAAAPYADQEMADGIWLVNRGGNAVNFWIHVVLIPVAAGKCAYSAANGFDGIDELTSLDSAISLS
jgi:hypothetical protein